MTHISANTDMLVRHQSNEERYEAAYEAAEREFAPYSDFANELMTAINDAAGRFHIPASAVVSFKKSVEELLHDMADAELSGIADAVNVTVREMLDYERNREALTEHRI